MRRRAILFAVLAVAPLPPAFGLDPKQPVKSYLRTQFTMTDGLPSDIVNGLAQAGGFLWIAAPSVLVRFDGWHFVDIRLNTSFAYNTLATGPDGDLWIGTETGVARLSSQLLAQRGPLQVSLFPSPSVQTLCFARDGTLWAGTNEGLYRLDGGRLAQVVPGAAISHIEEMHNGHLFLVTSQGVFEWDGSRSIARTDLVKKVSPSGDVYHVFEDRSGSLWIGAREGATRISGERMERIFTGSEAGKPQSVFRVFEERNGRIWMVTSTGVKRVSGSSVEALEPVTGGRAIVEDRDGNLWIGTNGQGLVRLRDRPVTMVGQAGGLPNEVVTAVLTAHDGTLWVGNNCAFGSHGSSGGISRLDGTRFHTYNEKDGLVSSCVTSLTEDSRGDIWVGTYGGVFRLHQGKFERFWKSEGLLDDSVSQVLAAPDDSIWAATQSSISRLRNGRFRNYTPADGLSDKRDYTIYLTRDGTIWAGERDGLIQRFDGTRFVSVWQVDNGGGALVAGQDQKGNVYFDMDRGWLSRWSGQRTIPLTGLRAGSMATVDSELWLAGSDGIERIPATEAANWTPDRNRPLDYTIYGNHDGMISQSMFLNMAITPDRRLWVPTTRGLAVMDLARLPRVADKPIIYVDSIAVDRNIQAAGRDLILSPGQHHLEISFDTVELTAPEHTRLQYRLEGVDEDWVDAGAVHSAVYTSIPLGKHQFRVRATNREGIWDREGIAYWITQRPHYYETRYFQFALAGAGLLVIFGLYQVRLQQSSARLRGHLEGKLAERERIARDLHDTLLQSIQGLVLIFEANVRGMSKDDPVRPSLEAALVTASAMLAEGRDRVHDLRTPSNGSDDLPNTMRRMAEEFARSTNVRLTVSAEGRRKQLRPDVMDEVYWIVREAVVNALNHSCANNVEIGIAYEARSLRVFVHDDGKGIDREVLDAGGRAGHWGIKGMQERAAKVGGRIVVSTEPMQGTTIELRIPASRAFAGLQRRFWRWHRNG